MFHDEALSYTERELSQTAGPVSSGPSKCVLPERSSFSQNRISFLSHKGKYNQLLLYWELDGKSTLWIGLCHFSDSSGHLTRPSYAFQALDPVCLWMQDSMSVNLGLVQLCQMMVIGLLLELNMRMIVWQHVKDGWILSRNIKTIFTTGCCCKLPSYAKWFLLFHKLYFRLLINTILFVSSTHFLYPLLT